MKRAKQKRFHSRTVFPIWVNFNGWWIESKKGTVAQLQRYGSNIHDYPVYHLLFKNEQIGNGYWSMENLINSAVKIRPTKDALNAPTTTLSIKYGRAAERPRG